MSARQNKPFPVLLTLISLSCIVTMLILGFWQLDRKQQKDARIQQMTEATMSANLSLSEVLNQPHKYVDYTITVKGLADTRLFYIDNKLHQGRGGYYIVQPISTEQGILLYNLGWTASSDSRNELPQVNVLAGQVEIEGMLAIPSDNVFIEETNRVYGDFPVLLQQVDLAEMSQHLNTRILPFILLADAEQTSPFVREWKQVVMAPEKHLGYAIQWFGLAVAALTIYLLSIGKYYKQSSPVDP